MFANVELYFRSLRRLGPGCGYYPKPSNNVLPVHPDNLKYRKRFDLSHGFKVCTGAQYLGRFIRDDESKRDWLEECTNTWERNTTKISKTAGKHPRKSYSAVVRVIQLEWIVLQRLIKNTRDAFTGVEKLLCKNFLPRILFRKSKSLTPFIESLSAPPIKKSILGLQNTVTSADKKYLSSRHASMEMIQSVTGEVKFSTTDRLLALKEERRDTQKIMGECQQLQPQGTSQRPRRI